MPLAAPKRMRAGGLALSTRTLSLGLRDRQGSHQSGRAVRAPIGVGEWAGWAHCRHQGKQSIASKFRLLQVEWLPSVVLEHGRLCKGTNGSLAEECSAVGIGKAVTYKFA